MTMSGDFIPNDDGDSGIANYPTVLGITLTPVVLAVIFVVLGLAIAVPLFLFLLQPKQQEADALRAEIEQKEPLAAQAKGSIKKLAEAKAKLETATQQKQDILTLFSDQRSLDVMLLDVNREFLKLQPKTKPKVTRPPGIPGAVKVPEDLKVPEIVLNSFAPGAVEVVGDGSLGPDANGKLQRQSFAISMNGDFNQTQSLLRSLESMQPLTRVTDFTMAASGSQPVLVNPSTGAVVPFTAPGLAVTFSLQTIVPIAPSPSPSPPPK